MQHLKDIFDSKGYNFIAKLFSNEVYITEKIDGSRFSFEKIKNTLIFYKRDNRVPISMIDRTVMKFYEPAISHIESLSLSSIPEGVRFGFEYFANSNPGSIVYDKIPKNGLILTDVNAGSGFDTNVDNLVKYAKKLKTSPPPIIFNGKLSGKQKMQLEDFLTTEWDDLFMKFKTESFTSYIIGILNPKLKNTALNIGTSKAIEGIVFSFNDGGTFINAKVVDPLYTQNARKKASSRRTPEKKESSTHIKEIIKDLVGFAKSKASYDLKFKSDTPDKRYVELLSFIFKQYYLKNKGKFNSIKVDQSYDVIEMDVNYKFIHDTELVNIIKSKLSVKRIFKTFLSLFGKTRKKATDIIDKSTVSNINGLIGKVKKLSENKKTYQDKMDMLLTRSIRKL